MGFNGLLRYFRSIEKDTDASKLKGLKVGVDGHSWIHKAIYGAGYSIVVNKDYSRCLKNILARIEVLLFFGSSIIFVLDGADLPAKGKTERDRADERRKALIQGYKELDEGKRDFIKTILMLPTEGLQRA